MKIGVILGTRPEIIKLSSTIRALQNQEEIERFIIHSNQHYSDNMDKIFFKELKLQPAKYNLGINGGQHGEMTGKMLIEIEKILNEENPDIILVQGDTNTVMSGALVASKMGIKVGHIEAGLRSYDRTMPEEINRIITDHISDFCFCPAEGQAKILRKEGIEEKKIFITGNTVVDAVYEGIKLGQEKEETVLNKFGLIKNNYIFLTCHRPSNVDSEIPLKNLLSGISSLQKNSSKKVIFPIHPRTKNNISKYKLDYLLDGFTCIEPIGFIENLILQNNSYIIATDSGGIQEEACIMKKKTIILRENTERPETLDVGGAILVGNDKEKIMNAYKALKDKEVDWFNPFGDGMSGKRNIDIIVNKLQ